MSARFAGSFASRANHCAAVSSSDRVPVDLSFDGLQGMATLTERPDPAIDNNSMEDPVKPDDDRIGFLATFSPADNVYLGGLLITNSLGRPLEFQCTAPVEPNATQALLYGPTLRPYVLNDLIGKTLLERVTLSPRVVLVDDRDMLPLRKLIRQPLACVCDGGVSDGLRVGRNVLMCHADFTQDNATVESACVEIPADADVAEPFERVRAALQEAFQTAANTTRGAA
jgi:hypothetical protein